MNLTDRFIVDCPSFEEFRKRTSALPLAKDKGDAFERLTQVYLQTTPEYRTALEKVWLLREVPASVRAEIGLPRVTGSGVYSVTSGQLLNASSKSRYQILFAANRRLQFSA